MPLIRRILPEESGARRWEILALSSVGAFMGPLDGSIVSVALPAVSGDLRLSFGEAIWVQAVYLLAMAILLIPLGRLADQRGRMRYYLGGVALFTVASVASGLSVDGLMLIVSRAFQGAGAALMVATSAAIVTAVFPPQQRGKALGINVMAVYIGLSVGPPLGGILVDTAGWRWIFLVNVPIGLAVLVWGALRLPHDRPAGRRALRPDALGAGLLAVFLTCLLVPISFVPQWGWDASATVTLLAVSGLALAGFVIAELRVRDPILDLSLLRRNRLFAAANLAALLNYMALYGPVVLTAIYLQEVQGRSAAVAGWLLLSQPVLQATLSPFAGRLSDRIGSRVLTTGGMVLMAVGLTLLATLGGESASDTFRLVVGLAVMGVGLASFSAPNSSAIMGSVGRDQLGLASGFLATMRVTGQALSVALLGAIAASQLGAVGAKLIFAPEDGVELSVTAASEFATGYRYAMATGAVLAV
ncbi:MAG: DHA2 family efflux MFS transporter permease subunit, partial [Actinobacteria bacterium]|nr:DHA2 family efflux MFS transporter permease subunit [Actinomycetota bacterium]